jgi:hypothetical protein
MSYLFSVPLGFLLVSAVALSIFIVPLVMYLINPAVVALGYPTALGDASIFGISTPVGYLSSLLIAIFLAVLLIIPWVIDIDRKKFVRPYSSGVKYQTKLAGTYLDNYIGEKSINAYVNTVGALLVFWLVIFGGLVYLIIGGVFL